MFTRLLQYNSYLCARFIAKNYIKTLFMINPIVKTIELPDGRTITLEAAHG